jgi:hypothetical protein
MHSSPLALPDGPRLAAAFLALGDDPVPHAAQRSLVRSVAAFAAAVALAVAAPLTAMTPPTQVSEKPAATLAGSKAPLAAADDEDDPAD